MDLCNSCCRWLTGKDQSSPEHDPLLSEDANSPRTVFETAADVAAALKSGKLPSQTQMDNVARSLLKSDFLTFPLQRRGQLSPPAMKLILDVRNFLEMFLLFGLEKNSDDKFQDLVHELAYFDSSHIITGSGANIGEDITDNLIKQAPTMSEVENDIATLIVCFRSLLSLFFTSVTFRALISSLIFLLRSSIATAAVAVNQVAQQVELAASGVENVAGAVEKATEEFHDAVKVDNAEDATVPVDLENIQAKAQNVIHDAVEGIEPPHQPTSCLSADSAEEKVVTTDIIVLQIRNMLEEASQEPKHIQSIQTILDIAKKYAKRLESSASDTTATVVDSSKATYNETRLSPQVEWVLKDAKLVLESLAGGTQSLDSVVSTLKQIIFEPKPPTTTNPSNALSEYLQRVEKVVRQSALEPDYITSDVGKTDLIDLVSEGRVLYNAGFLDPRIKSLFTQVSAFASAIENDRTTNRFITSLISLMSDAAYYVSSVYVPEVKAQTTTRVGRLSETFWNDLKVYFIPKILHGLVKILWRSDHGIPLPLPRLEFVDEAMEVAVDPRFMMITSATRYKEPSSCCSWSSSADVYGTQNEDDSSWSDWMLPSSVRIQRWTEIKVDLGTTAEPQSGVTTSNSVRIHVDDLFSLGTAEQKRLAFIGILYYLKHKTFPAYEDEGTLRLDLDFEFAGEGASLDIELQIDTASEERVEKPFRVHAVHLHLPDTVQLRPTIGRSKHWILNDMVLNPVIFPLGRALLKRQIRTMLEAWIQQGLQAMGDMLQDIVSEAEKRQNEREYAKAKDVGKLPSLGDWWRALLDTLSPEPAPGATETALTSVGIQVQNRSPEQEVTSTIAVGVVPQLVPDKAVPPSSTEEIAVEMAYMVDTMTENVEDVVRAGEDAAASTVTELNTAHHRFQEQHAEESRRPGWRSHLFG